MGTKLTGKQLALSKVSAIRKEFELIDRDLDSAAGRCWNVGRLLTEVKDALPRGEFDGFVVQYDICSRSKAYYCMGIFKKHPESSNALDDLSVRKLIGQDKPKLSTVADLTDSKRPAARTGLESPTREKSTSDHCSSAGSETPEAESSQRQDSPADDRLAGPPLSEAPGEGNIGLNTCVCGWETATVCPVHGDLTTDRGGVASSPASREPRDGGEREASPAPETARDSSLSQTEGYLGVIERMGTELRTEAADEEPTASGQDAEQEAQAGGRPEWGSFASYEAYVADVGPMTVARHVLPMLDLSQCKQMREAVEARIEGFTNDGQNPGPLNTPKDTTPPKRRVVKRIECPECGSEDIDRDTEPPTCNGCMCAVEYTRFRRKGFTAPTIQEVEAYFKRKEIDLDAAEFCAYYQARGWKTSRGVCVKDWQACVTTWKKVAATNGGKETRRASAL